MIRWLALAALLSSPAYAGMVVKRQPMYASATYCGDTVRNGSEECDTADLGSGTCVNQGFASGTLACLGSCLYDTSACVAYACPNTNLTLWWRLEGATLDATLDHTAGDTIADLALGDSTATIDTGGPKLGTNGLTSPSGGINSYAQLSTSGSDIVSASAGAAGFWLKWGSSGGTRPANGEKVQVFAVNESGDNRLRLYLVSRDADSGFQVEGYYKSGGVDQQTVTSAASEVFEGTWYHLQLTWDTTQAPGADVLKVFVNGVLKAGASTYTIAPYTVVPDRITMGMQYSSSLNRPMYFDQLIISSDATRDLSLCGAIASYP